MVYRIVLYANSYGMNNDRDLMAMVQSFDKCFSGARIARSELNELRAIMTAMMDVGILSYIRFTRACGFDPEQWVFFVDSATGDNAATIYIALIEVGPEPGVTSTFDKLKADLAREGLYSEEVFDKLSPL